MRKLLAIALFAINGLSYGQLKQPARWEEELKFSDESYYVISMADMGIALVRDRDKFDDRKRLWQFVWLDTALTQKWTTDIALSPDLEFLGYEPIPGMLNLMFRRTDTETLNIETVMINLATQKFDIYKTEVKLQIRLTHYTVVQDACVFGGYVGQQPVLVMFDLKKNVNFIVPGFFLADAELIEVRPNKNHTFNILISQQTANQKKLIFRTFDKHGNILIEDNIPIAEGKSILTGVTSVLVHDEVLIAGAYGLLNDRQASGLFHCLVDPFADQTVTYTEFPQLRHFLDYLPERKAGKIKQKAAEREGYGKSEFKTNVGIHRIDEFDGGFALFGESYLMSTSTNSTTPASPYYNPTARTFGQPYGGYYNPITTPQFVSLQELRFKQGFAIGFNLKGIRTWDFSISMDDLKSTTREQAGDIAVVDQTPHFLFKAKEDLKYLSLESDTTDTTKPMAIPIKLTNQTEEQKELFEEGNVRFWYGKHFFVWGMQSVFDRNRESDRHRRLFFINKVTIE